MVETRNNKKNNKKTHYIINLRSYFTTICWNFSIKIMYFSQKCGTNETLADYFMYDSAISTQMSFEMSNVAIINERHQ